MRRYKKRAFRKRSTFRRRIKRRFPRRSLAMRKFMAPELKYNNFNGSVTPNTTMTFTPFFFPSQGNSAVTRVGNKVLVKKIAFRFQIVASAASSITLNRIMILSVRVPNAGDILPSTGDIFDTPANQNVALYSTTTMPAYHVLMDKTFASVLTDKSQVKTWNFTYKKPLPVTFVTNSSSVGDVVKNALYFCYWSNQTVNLPTLYYAYHVRYLDV